MSTLSRKSNKRNTGCKKNKTSSSQKMKKEKRKKKKNEENFSDWRYMLFTYKALKI